MMHNDQATKLRRMMSRPNSRPRGAPPPSAGRLTKTIAVCSGKGGVGKSNVALNLSILLSGAGNRVALVDADMGMANLDVLLNADIQGDISHVVAGTKRLEEVVVDLPSGVQFVAGASGLARLANLSEFQRTRLAEELTQLEADNDLIIIDCAAGIGPSVLQFASGADIVLVVTTPEPTVLPPSRMAKRRPSSIAIGLIRSPEIVMLSPGMHISAPPVNSSLPVTSVVLK